MPSHATPSADAVRRHRPKTLTVFAAAFAAGAVLAYGVNRVVDVHTVQVEPQVESEPIFVALRSLPQGAPVTVWDVALKDWPKAMLPTTALRADASLEGVVLRRPIREGQPLLSVQLVRDDALPTTTAIAAAPAAVRQAAPGPAAATMTPDVSPAAPAGVETVAERFVPATPAEPVETVAPVAAPATAPDTASAAPTGAGAIATAPEPRSTDVEGPATPPAVDASRGFVAVEPPAAPSEPTPVPAPPQAGGTSAVAAAPLVAPLPALPSTDIGRSLAGYDASRAQRTAARDARNESVLDRTTEAEPPSVQQGSPRYHLVVPERVALAVDASFTQPQPQASYAPVPETQGPIRDVQPLPQAMPQAAAQARSGARRQTALPPAARKPAAQLQKQPQQPADRQPPSKSRGLSAWMPRFTSESRQR
ncbi:MAG: SAF domain-containing protein [Planctomycetaceae bacterium]